MENIIDRILHIDKTAQKQLEEARQQAREKEKKSYTDCVNIRKEIIDDADNTIANAEKKKKQQADESIEQLSEQYHRKISDMEQVFQQSHEKIEDEIFAQITGDVT